MRRASIAVDILSWRILLLAGFLLVWELGVRRGWMDRSFVSQPSLLFWQTWDWVGSGYIFRHLWVTMEEMLLGFFAGSLLGVPLGFLFAFMPKLARVLDPLMVTLNALPRVVSAPLFVL